VIDFLLSAPATYRFQLLFSFFSAVIEERLRDPLWLQSVPPNLDSWSVELFLARLFFLFRHWVLKGGADAGVTA